MRIKPAFFRAHRQHVPKAQHSTVEHRRPYCKQDDVLHRLAVQHEALVILLQQTHCTTAEKLIGLTSKLCISWVIQSRKRSLATFVHERLKYTLLKQYRYRTHLNRRPNGCVWMLIGTKYSTFTNLHQH